MENKMLHDQVRKLKEANSEILSAYKIVDMIVKRFQDS